MKTHAFAFCAALLAATPLAAQSYVADNRLQVNGVGPTSFEVVERRGLGARHQWCAAAQYVEDVLGIRTPVDLIIEVPRGPSQTVPGRSGVTFTIDADRVSAPLTTSSSVTNRTAGLTMRSGHAHAFCHDFCVVNEYV